MKSKFMVKALVFILIGCHYYSSVAQPSGDSTIDNWLNGAQYKGGSSAAPTTLNPSNYTTGLDKCNSTQAISSENNCTSDLFYTPNANTGGYQAFGVGFTNYASGTYYYPVCYIYWAWNGQDYVPTLYCNWYQYTINAHTYGAATARVKFGSNTTSTLWGTKPISTLAFKANNVYTPYYSSVVCQPNYTGSQAKCTSSSNAISVPNVGYEDKILVADHNCSLTQRTGSSSDANYNCFVRDGSQWWTDLPSPYPDTTYLDPGAWYVPSIGSAAPEQITEGYTYFWYLNFYQWAWESAASHTIYHGSSITTEITYAPNCSGSQLWNCFFQVDQTYIAPSTTIP